MKLFNLGGFLLFLSLFVNKEKRTNLYLNHIKHIENNFINNAKMNYNIFCSGSGGKMLNDIEEVSLSFNIYKPICLQEARCLEVVLIEDLLNRINTDQNIKPFLREHPFTSKRVNISISYTNQNGGLQRNTLCHISSVNGMVYYSSYDGKSFYDIKVEPFEEAQRIAHENPISLEEPPPTIESELKNTWNYVKSLFINP